MEQRVRSNYNIISTPLLERAFPQSCLNKIWTNDYVTGAALNGESEVMSDYVTPRFRQRQRNGEKFFNPMYKEKLAIATVGNSFRTISQGDACPGGLKGQWIGTGPTVAVLTPRDTVANSHGHFLPTRQTALDANDVSRVQRVVSTEVLSKRGRGDSELWETLAEYRQTLDMLNNPLNKLKDLSSRILKSCEKGVAGRALIKEVSDGYLLYRYGVLPLMKDIKSIIASLEKPSGDMEKTVRAKEQLVAQKSFQGQSTAFGLIATWQCQVDEVLTVRGMALDRGYVSFANNLGFDLRGLALLPLQLTSYSFVADWFSNLSSYVAATIPALGWQSLGNALVVHRAVGVSYKLLDVTTGTSPYTLLEAPTGSVAYSSVSTTRSPLMPASFEMVSDFKFDHFSRVADAIALVASRFVKLNSLIGYRPNNSAFHDKKAYHHWANQPGVQ